MERLSTLRLVLAFSIAIVLAGCATQGTPLWITHDYDPAQDPRRFERDRYECQRDATYMHPGTAVGIPLQGGGFLARNVGEGAELNADLFNACMNAKGYTLTWR